MISLNKKNNIKAGFTLFVAMIVSSLLLAVGFSIGNIILKQLLLSGSGKDSQIAFYAADSGAECAQFWDARDGNGDSLATESPFATSTTLDSIAIKCGSGAGATSSKVVDATMATTTLVVDYTLSDYRACANVQIVKGFDRDPSLGDIPYTKITSRGYNSSMTTVVGGKKVCDTTNARTVERGLFVQY